MMANLMSEFIKSVDKYYSDRYEMMKATSIDGGTSFNIIALKSKCPYCSEPITWRKPGLHAVKNCKRCGFELEVVGLNPFKIEISPEWADWLYMF